MDVLKINDDDDDDLRGLKWPCGSEVEGFESIHGGFGFGRRNVEGDIGHIELCCYKHMVRGKMREG